MPYVEALLAGVLVGAAYTAVRVKSPAPPPAALCGLLGMLVGQALLAAL
ncbi:DUF1427 family protein [Streptomyces sp. NRRL S-340]|nr:DUF1427 family protein [Streptomyces sp. NRRL S-340]